MASSTRKRGRSESPSYNAIPAHDQGWGKASIGMDARSMRGKNILGFPDDDASFDRENMVSMGKQIKNIYHLWLIGDVGEPKQFLKWYDILQTASEDDLVIIHINSYGGELMTTIQLVTHIKTSQAQVVCQIESACASAATMIALACQGLLCYPHGYMMIHTASGGTFGKQSDIRREEEFYNPWLSNFFHEIYKDFLTKKEIDDVLNGHDMWLGADDIMARFQHKVDVINKANAKAKKQEKEHMKKICSFMSSLQHKDDEESESSGKPAESNESAPTKKTKNGGKENKPRKGKPSSTRRKTTTTGQNNTNNEDNKKEA